MKFIWNSITVIGLLFLTAACGNQNNNTTTHPNATTANQSDPLEITGTIQQQGITSYQYGTHTLTNDQRFYVLESDQVDLDAFLNRKVTIVAEKREGYPVDGGPDYLRVLEIKHP